MIVCMWPLFYLATGETFCCRLGKHSSVIVELSSITVIESHHIDLHIDLLWCCMYVCTI